MDIGWVELLVFVVPVYALAAYVLYWVIRLAVRHGTLDAYRIDREDQRFAKLAGVRRQEQAAYGGDEPE